MTNNKPNFYRVAPLVHKMELAMGGTTTTVEFQRALTSRTKRVTFLARVIEQCGDAQATETYCAVKVLLNISDRRDQKRMALERQHIRLLDELLGDNSDYRNVFYKLTPVSLLDGLDDAADWLVTDTVGTSLDALDLCVDWVRNAVLGQLKERVCAALQALHTAGWVHGDVHAANIVAVRTGEQEYTLVVIDVESMTQVSTGSTGSTAMSVTDDNSAVNTSVNTPVNSEIVSSKTSPVLRGILEQKDGKIAMKSTQRDIERLRTTVRFVELCGLLRWTKCKMSEWDPSRSQKEAE